MDRPRSASNASATSYIAQRRPSVEQIHQTYHQPSYAGSPVTPQAPQGMYPPQPPAQQWHGQAPQQGAYMQPPPPPGYAPQQQGYPVPNSQPMAPPSYGFMPPQYPTYDHSHVRHNSVEYPQPPTGPPRSTSTQPMQHQMAHYPQPPLQPQYAGNYPSQVPAHTSPIQTSQPGMQSSMPTTSAPYTTAPQPPTAPQYTTSPIVPADPGSQDYYGSKFAHQPQSGAKRTFSDSFDAGPLDQPLRQGARPNISAQDPKYQFSVDSQDEEDSIASAMSYRRADGTQRRRRVPLVS